MCVCKEKEENVPHCCEDLKSMNRSGLQAAVLNLSTIMGGFKEEARGGSTLLPPPAVIIFVSYNA